MSYLNSSAGEELITQHGSYLVSNFFLGEGHWIYFIYTSVNYSGEVFLDGAS